MVGWVDLGYPTMHRPGVELAIFRSLIRRPDHYTAELYNMLTWVVVGYCEGPSVIAMTTLGTSLRSPLPAVSSTPRVIESPPSILDRPLGTPNKVSEEIADWTAAVVVWESRWKPVGDAAPSNRQPTRVLPLSTSNWPTISDAIDFIESTLVVASAGASRKITSAVHVPCATNHNCILCKYDKHINKSCCGIILLGTCEASIFDSNSNRPSDSIRFEGDWPIRIFSNRIGRACFFARRKLSQMTQTINGT